MPGIRTVHSHVETTTIWIPCIVSSRPWPPPRFRQFFAIASADILTSGNVNPDPPMDGLSLLVGYGANGSVEINGGSTFTTGTESEKVIFLGARDNGIDG